MSYIESLQHAIHYIEEHILKDIQNVDVANYVHMSNFHFQRIFSLLTNITLKEYVRNRRLSMAGQELLHSNQKIIDIAYKYGYDNPESFSRAFLRFHGVSPKMARKYGSQLKLYDPLVIRINIQGGKEMNYRIEHRKSFKVLAKVKKFPNSIINEENNMEISNFWSVCVEENIFKELFKTNKALGIYGLCSPVSKTSNHFCYGIGVEYKGGIVPEHYEIWDINEGMWAVFEAPTSEEMDTVWQSIYNEFIPNSGYDIVSEVDFEYYPNHARDYFCEIWVPVAKKTL